VLLEVNENTTLDEKIKECKDSMHQAHSPIYNRSLGVEKEALEWVQEQIQHLVINNERKDTKVGLD
jgi:hypothetical protein